MVGEETAEEEVEEGNQDVGVEYDEFLKGTREEGEEEGCCICYQGGDICYYGTGTEDEFGSHVVVIVPDASIGVVFDLNGNQ